MTLPKAYDPSGVEEKQYAFWESRGYFRGHVDASKTPFAIVIPPPNVTGELHIGHALNNTLQDVVIRHKRMEGDAACWFPGTDHAGIATQNVVERKIAEDEGLTRHDLGRERFVERVWDWKETYLNRIRGQLKALGCSCDWERERFTLDEGLSNAVREVFVRLWEAGKIYQGEYIINWCPRCLTALSDLEVEHEETQGKLYRIRYPIKDSDESIVIATTRPETMLADTGVAVHPDDDRHGHHVGKTVVLPLMDREIPVVADEGVDPEFGTGALKITPAHDPLDLEIGERHGLDVIDIFHDDATTNDHAGLYAGLSREDARERVVADLDARGLLESVEDYQLPLGQCERCDTPVEPRISKQWFLAMEELAQPAIEAVRDGRIQFTPERWRKVYFDWMENIQDWCISRQLWWGHRIPAWHCDDCAEITVARETPTECRGCGSSNIQQDEDVLDTWFSSQLWPFSIMGWPEETGDLNYFYPTSLLSTAPDIIFFWVARMIVMGLHFREEIPFKQVLFHPIIKDKQGRKMSKSRGNTMDPLEMRDQYGMDAVRFTLASGMSKSQDLKLDENDIDGARRFLNKIWNATRFALMHLEDFEPEKIETIEKLERFVGSSLRLEDRWMLSSLSRTIEIVQRNLDSYDFNVVGETLYDFVWHEVCDWYLELIKPRLNDESQSDDRLAAQRVLGLTLRESLKLLHPMVPFITEELWQVLPGTDADSVMIAPFPRSRDEWADPQAEQDMNALQELITGIRTLRSELKVPPETGLRALIRTDDAALQALCREHEHYFRGLARVEALETGPDLVRPSYAARRVLQRAEVLLPLEGIIDLGEQQDLLAKELEDARSQLERTRRKLEDTDFLEKAPREIVDREKARADELAAKVARLEENLESLGAAS